MKKILILLAVLLLLSGCRTPDSTTDIAATTLPVYEFTARLCEGTGLQVSQLVTESVSCLHDYSLNVRQVQTVEAADLIVINGAGLEEFMHDLIHDRDVIDASAHIEIIECDDHHDHEADHGNGHDGHNHEVDSHIWLSPENARTMAANIYAGLIARYPEHQLIFEQNLAALIADFDTLENYATQELHSLSCRDLVTFHDGFSYLAESFDLHILKALEEESGAEASAAELKEIIGIVREHHLPAIFTELNGSDSAARIIAAETGIRSYALDMAMSGDSWFDAMYHNIDTLKEALE